ncbi:hypothetical protein DFH06DRAFT_1332953 [Mycena polygramma]|nr:hypothetical protein DFH06DRAFT_1332953 [Mycena polygramma]
MHPTAAQHPRAYKGLALACWINTCTPRDRGHDRGTPGAPQLPASSTVTNGERFGASEPPFAAHEVAYRRARRRAHHQRTWVASPASIEKWHTASGQHRPTGDLIVVQGVVHTINVPGSPLPPPSRNGTPPPVSIDLLGTLLVVAAQTAASSLLACSNDAGNPNSASAGGDPNPCANIGETEEPMARNEHATMLAEMVHAFNVGLGLNSPSNGSISEGESAPANAKNQETAELPNVVGTSVTPTGSAATNWWSVYRFPEIVTPAAAPPDNEHGLAKILPRVPLKTPHSPQRKLSRKLSYPSFPWEYKVLRSARQCRIHS